VYFDPGRRLIPGIQRVAVFLDPDVVAADREVPGVGA
jgi:hypothetical protein